MAHNGAREARRAIKAAHGKRPGSTRNLMSAIIAPKRQGQSKLDFQRKIIAQDIEKIAPHIAELTDWEKLFFYNIRRTPGKKITPKQFNRLQEIAERFR